MKKSNRVRQQKGFFDLGFSLVVLALSGAVAYTVTPQQEDRLAVQEPQIELVANYQNSDETAGRHH